MKRPLPRPRTRPPRLAILQDEDGNPTAAVSDDPRLSDVKVVFLRRVRDPAWSDSLGRPENFLVQYRADHESITRLVRLTFYESVITDQTVIDNMRDMDEWNFDISLLLASVYRVEQVLIGCERYTPGHADPMAGIVEASL